VSALEAANKAVLRAPRPARPEARMLQLLDLKSIGPIGGQELVQRGVLPLMDESPQVGQLFRPPNHRHTLRQRASRREQGISKAGNRRARKLGDRARLAVGYAHQPGSELSGWFPPACRRHQGAVAPNRLSWRWARKLRVALWRYHRDRRVPTGAVLRPSL